MIVHIPKVPIADRLAHRRQTLERAVWLDCVTSERHSGQDSDTSHQLAPVTPRARLASFFLLQSLLRDRAKRGILCELDAVIVQLSHELPKYAALKSHTSTCHNLLRQWAEV
jgi:predicted 2-oxoglutarate/Fe(II)-dependent dioxygenase YbiX